MNAKSVSGSTQHKQEKRQEIDLDNRENTPHPSVAPLPAPDPPPPPVIYVVGVSDMTVVGWQEWKNWA